MLLTIDLLNCEYAFRAKTSQDKSCATIEVSLGTYHTPKKVAKLDATNISLFGNADRKVHLHNIGPSIAREPQEKINLVSDTISSIYCT